MIAQKTDRRIARTPLLYCRAGLREAGPAGHSRHVDGHRQLYRAIVGRESGVIVERKMRRMLAGLLREDLTATQTVGRNEASRDLAIQHVVGALWSVLTWWMDYRGALSPEEMNTLFRQLTLPGLKAVLNGK